MTNFNKSFNQICEEEKAIGANIVVCNQKNILSTSSFGLSNVEDLTKSSNETIYRIASISKTVGAIGLMQLVEKGLINLDDDISKYLGYKVVNPNYPDDIITVKMLTTQTSSIQDGYDDENPLYDDIKKGYNGVNGTIINVSLKDLLTNPESPYYTPLTFGKYRPGERFCYSNFGCGIMACIIELVSGELYVDYMENHVFKPLGLNAGFKANRIKNPENIASMYYFNSKGRVTISKNRFIESKLPIFPLGDNYRGPAGGLFISMNDLSKIMRMFLNYGEYENIHILNKETVEYMYQMHWIGSPENEDYRAKGIQMKIINTHSFPLRGHTGGAYGVRSYMFFNIKQKIGACFITNGFDDSSDSLHCIAIFNKTIELFTNPDNGFCELNTINPFSISKDCIKTDRLITHNNLFLDKDYILVKALCDALDIVPIYDEQKGKLSILSFNITDFKIYNQEVYVHLEKTLKLLDICFSKHEDFNYNVED